MTIFFFVYFVFVLKESILFMTCYSDKNFRWLNLNKKVKSTTRKNTLFFMQSFFLLAFLSKFRYNPKTLQQMSTLKETICFMGIVQIKNVNNILSNNTIVLDPFWLMFTHEKGEGIQRLAFLGIYGINSSTDFINNL